MELTEESFFKLDELLAMNGTEESMVEASEIHGFLTALVSSKVEMSALEEIEAIWGVPQVEWVSEAAEEEYSEIIAAMKAEIQEQMETGKDFEPLLSEFEDDDGETLVDVELWCEGYCLAVELMEDVWAPLFDAEHKGLNVITLFGTEEGHNVLDVTPDEEIDKLARAIAPAAMEVFDTFNAN